MTPNPDSRAQESSVGSSATQGPSSVAEAPARDPFDEMVEIANRAIWRANMFRCELESVRATLVQIERYCETENHPALYLARGHKRQIERLLEVLDS